MTDDLDDHELIKSRTQLKREAENAQALGERLLDLNDKQLKSLKLDEGLMDAIMLAKSIKAHGGRKRQLQYIGKLMRVTDLEPITQYFDQLDNKHNLDVSKFKALENWRDKLVAGGNAVVHELKEKHPELDEQKLRQLVRNAANNKNEKLATKSKRAIFQYLKEIMSPE